MRAESRPFYLCHWAGGYTTTVAQSLALTLLTAPAALTLGYAGISTFVATRLVYAPPEPVTTTPAALGLDFRAVTLCSRGDGVPLRGWFIPGLLPNGLISRDSKLPAVRIGNEQFSSP